MNKLTKVAGHKTNIQKSVLKGSNKSNKKADQPIKTEQKIWTDALPKVIHKRKRRYSIIWEMQSKLTVR